MQNFFLVLTVLKGLIDLVNYFIVMGSKNKAMTQTKELANEFHQSVQEASQTGDTSKLEARLSGIVKNSPPQPISPAESKPN